MFLTSYPYSKISSNGWLIRILSQVLDFLLGLFYLTIRKQWYFDRIFDKKWSIFAWKIELAMIISTGYMAVKKVYCN